LPEPEEDLQLLIDAARAAGDIATRHFRATPKVWEKPDGAGPVTEADLEVDAMLRDTLCAARPGYGWLSEETPDSPDRLSRDTVFIVDPIDGTRAFIDGQPSFAHSLAVVRHGRPVAGVVYLPVRDRMFTASIGQGASLNGHPISAGGPASGDLPKVFASKPNLQARNWPGGVPQVEITYRPSIAYRLALMGTGKAHALVAFRDTWEWDVAAGALIATEAGAIVTDRTGDSLRFNNLKPLVNGLLIAQDGLHKQLVAAHNGDGLRPTS